MTRRTKFVGVAAWASLAAWVGARVAHIDAPELDQVVMVSMGSWFGNVALDQRATDKDQPMPRPPDAQRSRWVEECKRNQRIAEEIDDVAFKSKPWDNQVAEQKRLAALCNSYSPDNQLTCDLPGDHRGVHERGTAHWYGNVWFDEQHANPVSPADARRLASTTNVYATVQRKD